MGKLVQLEVNNFKSYRGHHVLLFGDAYFTSIIGPNGSGKSNSMDAISFVLGMKASALRSGKLEHLVYRGRKIQSATINADGTATAAEGNANGDTQDNDTQGSKQRGDPTSAWVMAIFEDDAGQTHRWKRIITGAGQSEYKIDGRSVTQKGYNEALEEQSILVKARNFLVFQGDVESVASQNPKDLTRLIEQISGSLEHKEAYDTLKVAADQALENQSEQLQMRRQINKEVDAYQTEKAAADKYEGWIAQRDEAIITQVLWKLFHFQQTIQASSEEIAKHQEELKEHKRGVAKYEQKYEEAKQAQAKATRHVNKTEREIRTKEKEIEDGENKLVPIEEKIKISTKDLQKFETRIAALIKDRDNEQQQVDQFKKHLATVEKAQQKWEDETKAARQKAGRELSDQDLQEYNQLRSDVTKQTHADQMKITELKRLVQTDQGTVTNLKQKVEGIEAQIEKLEAEITTLQEKQQELKDQTKQISKERDVKQHAFNKLESDRRNTERQATEWNQDLREALFKLNDAERDSQQSRKEKQLYENVLKLKKNINNGKGVHGRYRDLCRAKQKKYSTAMMTLLGWQLDAIIVDTQKIAQDCINYSREMRLGQFNFIPLDTITIKTVNPNLKGIHKGARLGIDCIEYEPHLERAMASACGDTLICDNIDVAKTLRYGKGVHAKCVTLDGTVIGKGGTMTGGRTSDKPDRVWNDKDIDEYRRKVEHLQKQLASLPKLDRRNEEMDSLKDEIAELDDQIGRARDEIQALEMNIQSKKKELNYRKQELKDYRPNYQKEAGYLQNHEDELHQYQDAVNAVADRVYSAFCQRLGFASIREYEDQQGTVQQEASEKRLEFTKQRSRLQNQIKFHENQLEDLKNRIKTLKAKVEHNESQIRDFEEEKEGLQNDIDTLNAELEQLQEKLTEVGLSLEQRKKVATEAKREVDKRNASVKDVMNAVDKLEAEIKRTASSRFALLRKCKVDEIDLPLAEGSAPLSSLPIGEAGPDPDAMDVDEDPTQINQPEVDDYGIEVDFDQLEEDLQDDASEAKGAELEDIIAKLTRDIDSAQVNLRAGSRLDATKDKLSSIEKNFDVARKAAAKAKKDFEDIKKKRHDLFMKAFDHISENIGGTYKDLTKSATFPLGGQAYLDMEDSEEPYLAGLKYHAMPPLKRFRDMEHLSGGEKTIAALALLFAIHSYQPSPFFVLDEVDAALDNVNIGRVAKYVKEHAGPGMQFIVISLKAGLFQESEGLVGVMRDQSRMTSKVVSLDLRKYRPS